MEVKKPLGVAAPAALVKRFKLNPNTKRAGVLRLFLQRGDRGLNCFEAVRLGHDYVLRSTVSDVGRDFGIEFSREWEKVPGHNDSVVDCVRYRLTPESTSKVRKMLGESAS